MGEAWAREAVDPINWIVVFKPRTESRLIRWFVPGRFKHVSAIAYLDALKAWVTFDVGTRQAKIMVMPEGAQADNVIVPWIEGCTLVRMTKRPGGGHLPFYGWCVPAVRHLLGMRSGALRPDTLYRHCLRDGGRIIDEPHHAGTGSPAAASG